MTLRHLRIFVAVCDCGSVTLAAERLHFTQPAVSLAVKELESCYHVKLFDRMSRRLYVTEDGKQFLRYARKIVSLFDEMEREVGGWDSSRLLQVGASITVGTCLIPKYVKKYSAIYPNVKVRVTVDNSGDIEKKVLSNELDFALIEGLAHSDSIVSQSFMKDELTLVCGAGHPLSKAGAVTPEELSAQTLILREKGSGTREIFDSAMLTQGIAAVPAWESVSTEAIISAVSEGIGVSVLPLRLVKRDIDAGKLMRLELAGVSFGRDFKVIYHRDKHLTPSARAFIELCCNG